MDEWMREGEKYLQSSTYNKYTASRGSKQNTVVTETGERKRSERVRGGKWERVFYMRETKTRQSQQQRVTVGEGGGNINKQVCLVSKTTV